MVERILNSTVNVMKPTGDFSNNESIIEQMTSCLNNYKSMDSIPVNKDYFGENAKEIERVMELIDTYLSAFNSVEDLKGHTQYTKEVYQIVDESKLDDFAKENFKVALSVAFASSKLWNPAAVAGKNE